MKSFNATFHRCFSFSENHDWHFCGVSLKRRKERRSVGRARRNGNFIHTALPPQPENLKDFCFSRHVYTNCQKRFLLPAGATPNAKLLSSSGRVYLCQFVLRAENSFRKSRWTKTAINCTLKLPNYYNRKCIAFNVKPFFLDSLPTPSSFRFTFPRLHNEASSICMAYLVMWISLARLPALTTAARLLPMTLAVFSE